MKKFKVLLIVFLLPLHVAKPISFKSMIPYLAGSSALIGGGYKWYKDTPIGCGLRYIENYEKLSLSSAALSGWVTFLLYDLLLKKGLSKKTILTRLILLSVSGGIAYGKRSDFAQLLDEYNDCNSLITGTLIGSGLGVIASNLISDITELSIKK